MRAIWKYILDITDTQCLDMPDGAMTLCVQMQGETLCLWAVVDPNQLFLWALARGFHATLVAVEETLCRLQSSLAC